MRSVTISKTLAAASATNIASSQAVAAAGTITLDGTLVSGGVATLDTQRRVLYTSTGDDSKITFTTYGTNESQNPIHETVAGTNGSTVATNLDFATVTKAVTSGAVATKVSIGTNGVGSTSWKNPSTSMAPFTLPINCTVSGTVTYALESTQSDYWTPVQPTETTPISIVSGTVLNSQTAAANLTIDSPIQGWRLTVSAGTGTVTGTAVQAGIVNY